MNFRSCLHALGLVLVAIILLFDVSAQNENGIRGFIRIVNAVGVGSGKLDVLASGKKVRSEGYDFGDVTGGIPRSPGSYTFTFQREGLVSGRTKINVIANTTTTLIPFGEYVPATESKEGYWTIRILRLKQSEDRAQTTATIVNLTRKDEIKVQIRQPDETWTTLPVKRLGLGRAPVLHRNAYVPVRIDEADLTPLAVGTSGNFVAILYEDEQGKIRSKNFQDFKYLSLE